MRLFISVSAVRRRKLPWRRVAVPSSALKGTGMLSFGHLCGIKSLHCAAKSALHCVCKNEPASPACLVTPESRFTQDSYLLQLMTYPTCPLAQKESAQYQSNLKRACHIWRIYACLSPDLCLPIYTIY